MDVRTLLNGKKTAVIKDDTSWQLSLSGLMKLGTEEDTGDGADVQVVWTTKTMCGCCYFWK